MPDPLDKNNAASVDAFLASISDGSRRADCETLIGLMRSITKEEPKMWGASMIGFGTYHYRYESGREGDTFITGFSPRKSALTLYLALTGIPSYEEILARLGKYKTGKGCLYLRALEDVDPKVLKSLITASVKAVNAKKASGG
jgi:Domain of unknown function (DU1801)